MMSTLPLLEIAAELQAVVRSSVPVADLAIANVCTDSRALRGGDLYVALRGERFDGHDFIAQVADRGAVAAVVSAPHESALPQLQVEDTRTALGLIARLNRRRFSGPVIGITGSAGKTTCKEMLAAILAQQGATLATEGNLNNEIGVPLTLLRIAPEHRYAVIEMGAARSGDIAYLCRFAEPDIALVTNAMSAHLEGFGSVDTIARTKGEIYRGLRAGGTAIVNIDSEYQPLWRQLADTHRVITFGFDPSADVRASAVVRNAGGVAFTLHSPTGDIAIHLSLLGLHNVRNALGAAAAALAAGVSLETVRTGLAHLRAMPGRLYACSGARGQIVIDDSYNASPGAVKAAIDVLADYAAPRQLILGNMAELGAQAEFLHREVARYAAERGIDTMWCVGPHAAAQVEAFSQQIGTPQNESVRARAFADNAALIAALDSAAAATVLVKGSRSAATETIVAALCGEAAGGMH